MFSVKFDVQRSLTIKKPVERVFATVADFKTWRNWSPWLCQEPGCPVDIEGAPGRPGHSQRWDGNQIGSGSMTLNHVEKNQQLDYDLKFFKPWKSQATAAFSFREVPEGTRVTWFMEGTVPVFLFFMKKMMIAMISSDYDRGLSMLAELLESGTVRSSVEVNTVLDRQPFWYMGQRKNCSLDEVGPSMEAVFCDLQEKTESGALPEPDFELSFYHSYDFVRGNCEYTSCHGYHKRPEIPPPAGYVIGEIGPHRALNVNHTGSYRHLGNAWSALIGCQRSRKLKPLKTASMYEIYENMPGETPDKDLKTQLYFPVK